ncbi:helix-turn-helix domain-containing protein [Flagellimonas zhangzhouensis]|uniref:Helix-turn-helix domain-containing protein n=1 Tax=Flagellimonas zhangzhouensis TaxID=1073328 RepID=A0A1H2VIW7_9FLAO|nr:helix-turn-helix domain-containing protein [Allomuricauda zhangzhouensis]SDQ07759.1 Helix-turn-helix domain-containing protein [Allomuricauda zhangzhouensis]SDW67829.1 Helix-turn-helix domain-containing protein [Allomuricauda zhangzhouensis]
MNDIQAIFDQIPLRFDLSSHLMLLGVVQGFFLALVIFLRAKKKSAINLFGWVLVIQCLVFLDVYLCYTGLIKYVIHFNDSTEPLVLLIAPSMYFFLYALLERKPFSFKKYWPHFILPVLYALSQITYYLSPTEVKLNAYLGAYYRNFGYVEVPEGFNYSYHFIKDEYRWLVLFSFTLYAILSIVLILKSRKKGWVTSKNIKVDKYIFSLNTVIIFIILLFTLLVIYINFDDDGGDHYIGIIQTVTIYITSFFILSESRFFEKSWIADKYETLASDSIQFEHIEAFLSDSQYFSDQDATLKSLAEKLDTNANTVSKLINSATGANFNDYINQKRVELAKIRLLDVDFKHLTVEAIGNSVGFKSKSAFYNAFKKHVGQSPSAYVKEKIAQKQA